MNQQDNVSFFRRFLRRLAMLDPGYRKAHFLEQKIDRQCEELKAAIDAAKFVDRSEEYIFQEVMEKANLKADPDCARYNVEALFYAGWIYRYWHYKTGKSSREIFRQADETEILQSYGLHVEANDLAVEDIWNAARNRSPKVEG